MQNKSEVQLCQMGMVGLGVMGRNLLLNMADNGFSVIGYDQDSTKVTSLLHEADIALIRGATSLAELVNSIEKPRAIMLLVPAGRPVDLVITALLPHLEPGDLIIDAGNSHFTDTHHRTEQLAAQGIHFLGLGVSGGEKGARHGPSLMPGGSEAAYEKVRPVLEAIAAKVNNQPCVTYLGRGAAGHYVKMVHNGIEYGIMQLLAETYSLMKQGLGFSNENLSAVYKSWNEGELSSYLLEITSQIFAKKDDQTSFSLIDKIVGVAQQKGTGIWTSQSAIELQVPVPTIDMAVAMRNLSVHVSEREQTHQLYDRPVALLNVAPELFVKQLQDAFYVAVIVTYAQGLALLKAASNKYAYQLNLTAVTKVWRGGCIIRAQVLDAMGDAFCLNPQLTNLLVDPVLAKKLFLYQENLRQVLCQSIAAGIPVPGLMMTLNYLDSQRSQWLPTNLIQAQRDYFGAHTYERHDRKGVFHTEWVECQY